MKILHFAIEDYARIPSTLVREERKLGHDSFLAVLHNTFKQYGRADYPLNLPLVGSTLIQNLKKIGGTQNRSIDNTRRKQKPLFTPHGMDRRFFNLRDRLWQPRIESFLDQIGISSFDLLILDGGTGFLRNGKIVSRLKKRGIKIIIIYYGSDFRTRGAIPAVEALADARFTFEFDHTLLDPGLTFLYYPFDGTGLPTVQKQTAGKKVRIGHAPTNRAAKGSDIILAQLNRLQKQNPVETVLIENMPYHEAIRQKANCDIFIDQIGALGYGMNSLEAMALGIPSAVQLMPDFENFLGAHPFITISENTIEEKLLPFIISAEKRKLLGAQGRAWTEQRHNPATVARQILNTVAE